MEPELKAREHKVKREGQELREFRIAKIRDQIAQLPPPAMSASISSRLA